MPRLTRYKSITGQVAIGCVLDVGKYLQTEWIGSEPSQYLEWRRFRKSKYYKIIHGGGKHSNRIDNCEIYMKQMA